MLTGFVSEAKVEHFLINDFPREVREVSITEDLRILVVISDGLVRDVDSLGGLPIEFDALEFPLVKVDSLEGLSIELDFLGCLPNEVDSLQGLPIELDS